MLSFVIHGAVHSPYVRVYARYWSPLKKSKPLPFLVPS
jgi:hypothetical protein